MVDSRPGVGGVVPLSAGKADQGPESSISMTEDAQQLVIGVPKETFPAEHRVALVPAGVGPLVKSGSTRHRCPSFFIASRLCNNWAAWFKSGSLCE